MITITILSYILCNTINGDMVNTIVQVKHDGHRERLTTNHLRFKIRLLSNILYNSIKVMVNNTYDQHVNNITVNTSITVNDITVKSPIGMRYAIYFKLLHNMVNGDMINTTA